MLSGKELAEDFDRNVRVIKAQADGLNHADSLLQTPYNINCLNWVVGHIVVGRDLVLGRLGLVPLLEEAEADCYRRESDPITEDGTGVVPLERLMELLEEGQRQIGEALKVLSDEDLSREVDDGRTLHESLRFAHFHDTYHTGQTELLRQVAGTNDKII